MPRKKRDATRSPGIKPRRVRGRREKTVELDPNDLTWLMKSKQKMIAAALLNTVPRPYYLSIEWSIEDGNPPMAPCFPCSHFRKGDRLYYAFAFSEHRDEVFELWHEHDSRKELITSIRRVSKR